MPGAVAGLPADQARLREQTRGLSGEIGEFTAGASRQATGR